jgi:nitrite reductase/ring-hydroxylating ferredoxin subunit
MSNEQKQPASLPTDSSSADLSRRPFLVTASGLAMSGGLLAAYGTFGVMLGRFVYPAAAHNRGWLFVCTVDALKPGEALDFTTPAGAKIVIARQGEGSDAESFLALSSVCPHLGCRVHWESQNDRFFCPCHNGAFDKSGGPIAGPPQAANQSLMRFPLKVENGVLYLEAPLTSLASAPVPSDARSAGVA